MENSAFDYILSLGNDCTGKYQSARYLHCKKTSPYDRKVFEHALLSGARDEHSLGNFLFDWIYTPLPALMEMLATDFEGFFQRENLIIGGNGYVFDTKYRFFFPHSFTKTDGKVLPETIDAEYEKYRGKFDYLIAKTRDFMRGDQRLLYVMKGLAQPEDAERLCDALAGYVGHRNFHVLGVTLAADARGETARVAQATLYEADDTNDEPAMRRWTGNDAVWQEMFATVEATMRRLSPIEAPVPLAA